MASYKNSVFRKLALVLALLLIVSMAESSNFAGKYSNILLRIRTSVVVSQIKFIENNSAKSLEAILWLTW